MVTTIERRFDFEKLSDLIARASEADLEVLTELFEERRARDPSSRFRVDVYRGGEYLAACTRSHFFPTADEAIAAWIKIGWGYEHPDEELEDWDAAEALLSETTLIIDQEASGADGVARILYYEGSEDSRLPVAVVMNRFGNEIARVAVEDRETAVA